jgi:hypothetical protein
MRAVLKFAFNNTLNASTGTTPFEFDLGYTPVITRTLNTDMEVAAV